MDQLSFDNIKLVAELRFNKGFEILLDSIQASIDDLTSSLHNASPKTEGQIMGKWRAMREIYENLKMRPEQFALEQVNEQELRDAEGPRMPERQFIRPQAVLSQEALDALKKAYDKKIKQK